MALRQENNRWWIGPRLVSGTRIEMVPANHFLCSSGFKTCTAKRLRHASNKPIISTARVALKKITVAGYLYPPNFEEAVLNKKKHRGRSTVDSSDIREDITATEMAQNASDQKPRIKASKRRAGIQSGRLQQTNKQRHKRYSMPSDEGGIDSDEADSHTVSPGPRWQPS